MLVKAIVSTIEWPIERWVVFANGDTQLVSLGDLDAGMLLHGLDVYKFPIHVSLKRIAWDFSLKCSVTVDTCFFFLC